VERLIMLKIAGEIGTKSPRTRRRFLRVLVRNVRAALERHGVRGRVRPQWSRLRVETEDHARATEALARVFGLHSISDAVALRFDSLDDLVDQAAPLFRDRVAGSTFAVRVKRSGEHPFRSGDVAVALGNALLADSAGVDLGDPQVEVPLEIAEGTAYALLDSKAGPGGLPLGVGGRAVSLFSGGFDSPVAAWMAMRRGIVLDLVVCDLGGCGQVDAALEVARELATRWAPGAEPPVRVVDLAPVVAALQARVEPSIRQVVLKRAMYRAAALVAGRAGAEAIVTGEALGQVSTQTLRNLAVAEQAAGLPVLRPLIGMDKEEILVRARSIGTHDASLRVHEHCAIATGRVETAAKLREVVGAEGVLDDSFIASAVGRARTVDVTDWSPGPAPAHVVDRILPGAFVIDVREAEEGPLVPGGHRLPFSRTHEWAPGLAPRRTYVFVCARGNRSEMVAHQLRGQGLEAFSLAGGLSGLPTRAA
jgi:thiamine biosynthesis protein ThiI